MITSSDIIHLPYTPDLTEAGIAYTLRSLPHGNLSYDRIRSMVAGVAVELAFRRHLSQQNIPFEIISATPFTEPDKHDVTLGGHRCDIKSFFISHRSQISEMRTNPSALLNAPALVPSDHHSVDGHSDNDLYLFAFLSGLIAASQNDLKKVVETDQAQYLTHAMPETWRNPFNWNPLAPLVLKSESDVEILVEISGQDAGRGFLTRSVNLPPKTRITVNDPFYAVSTVHVKNMPSARLGILSPVYKEGHVISPLEWVNIWIYGMDIYLAGYISRGEFRQHAKWIAPNSHVFQYDHTKMKNLAVNISSLNPLQDLFGRVQKWESQR